MPLSLLTVQVIIPVEEKFSVAGDEAAAVVDSYCHEMPVKMIRITVALAAVVGKRRDGAVTILILGQIPIRFR